MALWVKAEPSGVGWDFCESLWPRKETRRPSFSMPLVTCRVSDGLPFLIAVLNAAAIILYYLTNHWGHVRRCAISDRRKTSIASVRSIRSVGTAVRREPEHGDSMDKKNWLKALADEGGSNLYLTTGAPPSAKFNGELKSLPDERLSPGFTRDLAY